MKTFLTVCLATFVSVGFATAVQADNHFDNDGKSKGVLVSSNKLLGASIVNSQDENTGSIDSILLDEQGKAHYLIAGVGGVAGVGRTMIAIPVEATKLQKSVADSNSEWRFHLNMTQEKLLKAPPLTSNDHREFKDNNWLKANREYFHSDEVAGKFDAARAISLKQVTDADIRGNGNESVGHLDAVLLNSANLDALYAIVGDGGTLGVGEKYFALPFDRLRFTPGEEETILVSVAATKAAVHSAPQVTPEGYQELHNQEIRDRIQEFESSRVSRKPVIKE